VSRRFRNIAARFASGKLKSCEDIAEDLEKFFADPTPPFSGENFGKILPKVE
jgi:NADPH-dependent curcumin reductase CurA